MVKLEVPESPRRPAAQSAVDGPVVVAFHLQTLLCANDVTTRMKDTRLRRACQNRHSAHKDHRETYIPPEFRDHVGYLVGYIPQ